MRKFLALVMTAALALSMAAPAFADSTSQSMNLKGSYNLEETTKNVMSVEVSWDSMDFKYTNSVKKTWNPETMSYDLSNGTGAGWSHTSASIKVINHSDVAILADVKYDGSYGSISGSDVRIEGCEVGATSGNWESWTFNLNTDEAAYASSGKIGQIGVMVAQAQ